MTRPGEEPSMNRHARSQTIDRLRESPSQTAGPYVHIGCTPNVAGLVGLYAADLGSGALYEDETRGERITICGRVLDGSGTPLYDALVEIWQCDADGIHPGEFTSRGDCDPRFRGFGRCATDAESGEYRFDTIKPGRVPYGDGRLQAPHVTLWIVARGINIGLHTRLYFRDEVEANMEDPLLNLVAPVVRRETLIALRTDDIYTFDIRLQGEQETVFLDI